MCKGHEETKPKTSTLHSGSDPGKLCWVNTYMLPVKSDIATVKYMGDEDIF